MRWLVALLVLAALPAQGESLVASRTIRAQSVLVPADVRSVDEAFVGALSDPASAIGLESRVTIYAGQPLRAADLGAPALIERNQIVTLIYQSGALMIATEGRALSRAGTGEAVRIMNLASRTTVSGFVADDGTVHVGPSPL